MIKFITFLIVNKEKDDNKEYIMNCVSCGKKLGLMKYESKRIDGIICSSCYDKDRDDHPEDFKKFQDKYVKTSLKINIIAGIILVATLISYLFV